MSENDNYIPKFAVIVRFGNQDRGYTISAESRQAALDKLVKRIDWSSYTRHNDHFRHKPLHLKWAAHLRLLDCA